MSEYGREAFNELRAAEAEVERLRAENKRLRTGEAFKLCDDCEANMERPICNDCYSRSGPLAAANSARDAAIERAKGWEAEAMALCDQVNRLCDVRDAAVKVKAERDALSARLQAVRDWATADHGGVKRPIDIWPGLAAALAPLDASLGTPGDEKPSVLPVEPASNDSVERVWADTIRQVATSDGSYTVEIGGVVIAKAGTPEVADCTEGCTRHATCRDAPGDEKPQPSEPESMVWTVDLGGGMESPDGDDAAAHQRMVDSWVAAAAEKIVAWVNANGGEARYEPERGSYEVAGRTDTEIGFTERVDGSHIAVRTAGGWQYAKPGDRIVKGGTFDPGTSATFEDSRTLREFTVSPVESSGSES